MDDLKTFNDIKDYLKTLKIIYTSDYPQERTVREAISELREEGKFIFIKSLIGKGVYVIIEGASDDEIIRYHKAEKKHSVNHYRKTLRPVEKWIKAHNNAKLMGRLELWRAYNLQQSKIQ